MVTYEHYKTG